MSEYHNLIEQGRLGEAADRLYGALKDDPDTKYGPLEMAKLLRAIAFRVEFGVDDVTRQVINERHFDPDRE